MGCQSKQKLASRSEPLEFQKDQICRKTTTHISSMNPFNRLKPLFCQLQLLRHVLATIFSKWCRGRVDLFNSSEVFLQDRFGREVVIRNVFLQEWVSLISKDCHPDDFLIRSCRDRLCCCLLQLKLDKPCRRKWVDLARVTRSHPFGVSTSD